MRGAHSQWSSVLCLPPSEVLSFPGQCNFQTTLECSTSAHFQLNFYRRTPAVLYLGCCFSELLKKYSRCCAFLISIVEFVFQVRSSSKCRPRNLKLETLSTQSPLIYIGWGSDLFLLKSTIIYFVFMVFKIKLLSLHHDDSFSTSSLYADSSPPLMSPTTVVSTANFTMELLGWVGVQSYVYRV